MSVYQQRYWNQLKELKTHVIYLHYYAARSEKWDKSVNIFLAVTSSSSIAAWAIWQQYQIVWAVIIALSQIVTAVKPFLPYRQRVKAISELNDKIQEIYLKCEKGWFSVAEGELTDKEIHDYFISLRDKAVTAERRYFKNTILPKNKSMLRLAEKEAELYLSQNYS